MDRRGILGGGNWLVDRVKTLDAFPKQDCLCKVLDVQTANGGFAYNVLKDIRKMGADFPLWAAGALGEDAEADFILQDCLSLNLDTQLLVKIPSKRTSSTDVMTDSKTARRTFFFDPAAGDSFDFGSLDIAAIPAKILLCGYIGLLKKMDSPLAYAKFFARAKSLGFKTAADFASVSADLMKLSKDSFKSLSYVSLNEMEAAKISGRSVSLTSLKTLKCAAEKMFSLGLGEVALIHFKKGAYAFLKDGSHIWQGAVKVPREKIRGANGCGDALNAGFLYAMHENKSVSEALLWGAAQAASCLTNATASGGIKSVRQAVRYAKKCGFESEV